MQGTFYCNIKWGCANSSLDGFAPFSLNLSHKSLILASFLHSQCFPKWTMVFRLNLGQAFGEATEKYIHFSQISITSKNLCQGALLLLKIVFFFHFENFVVLGWHDQPQQVLIYGSANFSDQTEILFVSTYIMILNTITQPPLNLTVFFVYFRLQFANKPSYRIISSRTKYNSKLISMRHSAPLPQG